MSVESYKEQILPQARRMLYDIKNKPINTSQCCAYEIRQILYYVIYGRDIEAEQKQIIKLIKEKQQLPESIDSDTLKFYNQQVDDERDTTIINAWIGYRENEPIPQNLYYRNFQRNPLPEKHRPLYMWIKYRPNEPIPNDLYYAFCESHDKTQKPCKFWILYRPTELMPAKLAYSGWLQYIINYLSHYKGDDVHYICRHFMAQYFKPAYEKYLEAHKDKSTDHNCECCDEKSKQFYLINEKHYCEKCCKDNYKYFDNVVMNEINVDYTDLE